MKVICEKCESVFKAEAVTGMSCCPVCGEPFDDGDSVDGDNSIEDDGLMYFDTISTGYKERPEYNGVEVYCKNCQTMDSLDLDKFDKLVDKEYVILKENITITCRGCGKEHKPRKILYSVCS